MSGWRRIAILVSAVWMVGGPVYFSGMITDQAAMMGGLASDACEAKATREHRPFSDCHDAFGVAFLSDLKTGPTQTGIPILDGAVFALIALFAGWLAFGAVYAIVAWVRRGFASGAKQA